MKFLYAIFACMFVMQSQTHAAFTKHEFMSTHYSIHRLKALKAHKNSNLKVITVNDDSMEGSVFDEPDPLEPMNRFFFGFNRILDALFLRPLSGMYDFFTPKPVKTGVENFLDNLFTPLYIVNHLLQGEGEKALQSMTRFCINTTFGLAGVCDVAQKLPKTYATLNQTFARWGVECGPYLMLPFFGPTCMRGAFGKLGDIFINPTLYYTRHQKLPGNTDDKMRYFLIAAYGVDIIVRRANLLELTDTLERDAVDLYAAVRSVFFQKEQEMEESL